jgi:hypothetical protein
MPRRGHFNYFVLSGITSAIKGVHYQVILHWRKGLSRRAQKTKSELVKGKITTREVSFAESQNSALVLKLETLAII